MPSSRKPSSSSAPESCSETHTDVTVHLLRNPDSSRRTLSRTDVAGRLLRCTACGCDVDLVEIPEPWIDGDTYVCGPCLVPAVHAPKRPSLRLPDYDPKTAPFPEGY